jgi:quinol monooxygenase YgiN
MAFIQIIEVTTTRPEEVQELVEEWSAKTEGRRTVNRTTITADRDRPDTYVQIVEFPSYEAAMTNSALPETGEFAAKLAQLCDGPPVFRNLEVRRVDSYS